MTLKYNPLIPLNLDDIGPGSGGSPGGSDTQVQFNDGGSFGGDAGFVYNKTTDTATVGTIAAYVSGSTGYVYAFDGTLSEYMQMYHNGTYGFLIASEGMVIGSGSGSSDIIFTTPIAMQNLVSSGTTPRTAWINLIATNTLASTPGYSMIALENQDNASAWLAYNQLFINQVGQYGIPLHVNIGYSVGADPAQTIASYSANAFGIHSHNAVGWIVDLDSNSYYERVFQRYTGSRTIMEWRLNEQYNATDPVGAGSLSGTTFTGKVWDILNSQVSIASIDYAANMKLGSASTSGQLKVIDLDSGVAFNPLKGVLVADPNTGYGTLQSASTIDGVAVNSSGDVTAYFPMWLNYYSPYDLTLNSGSGRTVFNNGSWAQGLTANSLSVGDKLNVVDAGDPGSELVINGGFTTDSNWTKGTGWTISGNAANHASNGTGTLQPAVSLAPTVGRVYQVYFTVTNWTAGAVRFSFGGVTVNPGGIGFGENGTYGPFNIEATTTGNLIFTPNQTTMRLSLDSVSVKLLPGSLVTADRLGARKWQDSNVDSYGWINSRLLGFPGLTPVDDTDGEFIGVLSGGMYLLGNAALPEPGIVMIPSDGGLPGGFVTGNSTVQNFAVSGALRAGVVDESSYSVTTDGGSELQLGGRSDEDSTGLSRGGYIKWFHGDEGGAVTDETLEGYTFVNTNSDLVFSASPASSTTDTGAAYINLSSGNAAFAALQATSITNNTGLAAGTYTPTLSNIANVDSSTAFECQYLRVGNTVTVSGMITIDPTTISTLTQVNMTLPVTSNFGTLQDCGGVASNGAFAARIIADTSNDRAQIYYIATDTGSQDWQFTYTYQVI